MRFRMLLRLLLLLTCLSLPSASSVGSASGGPDVPRPSISRSVVVSAVRVIDGHTLEAYIDGSRLAIRVSSIEAPPINTPCGLATAERLRALAADGLRLADDPTRTFDQQNLRVYVVTTPDGRSVAEALVVDGLARADTGTERDQMLAAEAAARAARRGCLWNEGSGIDVTVVRVNDGNTIDAYIDGVRTLIRLVGVDAPASNSPCGVQAADRLRDLSSNGLRLYDDPSVPDDQHTQTYRAVTPDGRSVAEALVGAGLARAGSGSEHERLLSVEADARAARRGCLWGAEMATPGGDEDLTPSPTPTATLPPTPVPTVVQTLTPAVTPTHMPDASLTPTSTHTATHLPTSPASPPPTDCQVGHFRAEYFANSSLTGPPVLTRCEADIAYAWGLASPAAGVPVDNFSVRWSGQHAFSAGRYLFTVVADDGIRVWLDGSLLLTAWRDQSATSFTSVAFLSAYEHDVVVEYYDATLDAVSHVTWQLDPSEGVPSLIRWRQ